MYIHVNRIRIFIFNNINYGPSCFLQTLNLLCVHNFFDIFYFLFSFFLKYIHFLCIQIYHYYCVWVYFRDCLIFYGCLMCRVVVGTVNFFLFLYFQKGANITSCHVTHLSYIYFLRYAQIVSDIADQLINSVERLRRILISSI